MKIYNSLLLLVFFLILNILTIFLTGIVLYVCGEVIFLCYKKIPMSFTADNFLFIGRLSVGGGCIAGIITWLARILKVKGF